MPWANAQDLEIVAGNFDAGDDKVSYAKFCQNFEDGNSSPFAYTYCAGQYQLGEIEKNPTAQPDSFQAARAVRTAETTLDADALSKAKVVSKECLYA